MESLEDNINCLIRPFPNIHHKDTLNNVQLRMLVIGYITIYRREMQEE